MDNMNFFEELWSKLSTSVDFIVVGLVFLSGFFQSQYLDGWRISKNDKRNGALKTLIVSLVACGVYIVLSKDETEGANWAKYFLSYFAATSLYELGLKLLIAWAQKKWASLFKKAESTDQGK